MKESTAAVQDAEGDTQAALSRQIARRRTFAIISHPDAGKTTLTEKFLLYGGAIDLAGAVRTRRNQRRATSDWMALEQQRGISITTTVLQFDYQGYRLNLLDTPGHQDFSEDTYRTLMAVDSAVMVLDAAKGIEPQTRKLFEVCRARRLPILTFINKMDLPAREPLDLLDEIERDLALEAAPLNWPIGDGRAFQGVYDLVRRRVLRFQRTEHGQRRSPVIMVDVDDPALAESLGGVAYKKFREEIELLTSAGSSFDRKRFLAGELTPVFFGSALNNFGVETFLRALLELAPAPGPYMSDTGAVEPSRPDFSGFVFKIQANMDPLHRDRVAFLRVCSGRFRKDMQVYHPRLRKWVRMARPHRLFARDRETVEEAYPGDVIGLVNPGQFVLGDTVCTGAPLRFEPIPRFPPEHFAILRNRQVDRYKRFQKGLEQLEEEGAIQLFFAEQASRREPIAAAVGQLQLEVAQARLRDEYGVEAAIEPLAFQCARWIDGDPAAVAEMSWPRQSMPVRDWAGRLVGLFSSEWELEFCIEKNPRVEFKELG